MKKGLAPRNICLYSDLTKAQIELVGLVLQPRPRSRMGFASDDDDDDIYVSEHCSERLADLV